MKMEKPDKAVAEAIKIKMTEKKLIKSTHSSTIVNKLSTGIISEQDWKLMAELSLERKEGESDVKKN